MTMIELLVKIAILLGVANLILITAVAWKLHITHHELYNTIIKGKS